jgi:hypothetical protein
LFTNICTQNGTNNWIFGNKKQSENKTKFL